MSIRGFVHPTRKPPRPEDLERALPATGVVAPKVVVNSRDLGLDGPPQGPSDVGHKGEEVHARELPPVAFAEVRLAKGGTEVLVELCLLRGVAEVEAGVVVPAQLVVDDSQSYAVVDEVLAQQVVVAGRQRQRRDRNGSLDVGDLRQPVAVAVRNRDVVLVDDAQVVLDQPKHVEVVEEARRRSEEPRLNSSHVSISYAVFCLKKKKKNKKNQQAG